jgi:hypothetical protein
VVTVQGIMIGAGFQVRSIGGYMYTVQSMMIGAGFPIIGCILHL